MTRNTAHPEIDVILERHGIPTDFRGHFYRFAETGKIQGTQFRFALQAHLNFKAAAAEILDTMSTPAKIYTYESIED